MESKKYTFDKDLYLLENGNYTRKVQYYKGEIYTSIIEDGKEYLLNELGIKQENSGNLKGWFAKEVKEEEVNESKYYQMNYGLICPKETSEEDLDDFINDLIEIVEKYNFGLGGGLIEVDKQGKRLDYGK